MIDAKKSGRKIACLTAYDYPMAKLLDGADLDFILVGDSLGMVVLGHPDTTGVRMEDMLHHTRAVARGATKTWIVADLPAGSYSTSETAVENSARLIEAGADAVKIEEDLIAIVPQKEWTEWAHLMIAHGRAICQARKPQCAQCPLKAHCPSAEKLGGLG